MRRLRCLASLALLGATFLGAPANAADILAPEAVVGVTPACDDPRVLGQVEDQFEYGAVHMLQSDLTVTEFSDLHEKAWFPREEEYTFERRFCQGRVLLSNHEHHTIYYRVAWPQGYASIGWKAEGCVLGLDRWNIYGANCQSLRRF